MTVPGSWRWWLKIGINETAMMRPTHYMPRRPLAWHLAKMRADMTALQAAFGEQLVPVMRQAASAFAGFAAVWGNPS